MNLPDNIKVIINEYLTEDDHKVLALTCWKLYWEKWDIIGCYTHQIEEEVFYYIDCHFPDDDFVVETWYEECKEIQEIQEIQYEEEEVYY